MHEYKYPRPAVTVDIVVFGTDIDDKAAPLKVLLIRRARGTFKDAWALPGGYVRTGDGPGEQGEDVETAAHRELEEETGINVSYLEQLYTFGRADRDPRGRTISVAYFALVRASDYTAHGGGDAAEAIWKPISEAKDLAFDHDEILKVAVERLQAKVRYAPLGFDLLPTEFTLVQLHRLYEAVLMRPVDRRNFYRKAKNLQSMLQEVREVKRYGRPTAVYKFDKAAYDKAVKRGFNFEV
jgi:ADP-ribose pyrophosphatase YjhB (NUDIX family)